MSVNELGRRQHQRVPIDVDAHVRLSDEIFVPCHIHDVSCGGAKLRLGVPTLLPKRFLLEVPANVPIERRCILRWQRGTLVGVGFVYPKTWEKMKLEDETPAAEVNLSDVIDGASAA